MSTVTSQALTLNVAAQIKPTGTPPNISAVVLQNLSPYQLAVTYAGNQYALAPYMADIYPALTSGGASLSVVPSDPNNNPAGLPAYVTATWYTPSDAPPDSSGFPTSISPPAVAIGLAVAEQLLASGVPVPLQTTLIGNVAVLPTDPVGSHIFDVSQYASLQIVHTFGTGFPITVAFGTDIAGGRVVWQDEINSLGFEVPVFAQYVDFYAPTSGITMPSTANFAVYGTNRPVSPAHAIQQSHSSSGFRCSAASVARVAGTTYQIPLDQGVLCGGPVFLALQSGGTTVGGEFQAVNFDGTVKPIGNTGEMFTTAGSNKAFYREAALAANIDHFQFACNVAGTNALFVWATPSW